MKNNKLYLLGLLVLGFGLFSCKNNTTEAGTQNETQQTEIVTTEQENELMLDNGNKWQVNEAMKPYVQQGEMLVTAYINNNAGDYITLATQLKEQNSLLIKSCTMTGTAHDELHKWLYPHLGLVKQLEAATTDEAQAIIQDLQVSYQTYSEFFE